MFVDTDGQRTMAKLIRVGSVSDGMPCRRLRFRLVLSAALALSGGALHAEPGAPSVAQPPAVNLRSWNLRQTPIVEAVKRVRDAVVNIHSERAARPAAAEELFSGNASHGRVNGMGTGILIDPHGYIVTNQHVVEDVSLIRVRLADGTAASARVVARDSECDLALLKIDVDHPLATLPLGATRDLMVGETVIAIGNAYGYEHSVTVGVVSAVSRDVTLNKEVSYKALIQTDASINPGNSGGPLLNVHGELIGVNVAIRAGAQGIGFAIPVETMIRVTARMLASRAPQGSARSRLGLSVKDDVHLPTPGSGPGQTASLRSVIVDRVDSGSSAARAGLERGDILLAAGDIPIAASLDVERAFFDRQSGERVALRYRRNGQDKSAALVLESFGDLIWHKLGLRLQAVGAEAVRIRPVAGSDAMPDNSPKFRGGLMIAEVRGDSPAERAGVQRGDILVGLHRFEMLSNDNVQYVLNQSEISSPQALKFYVLRNYQLKEGQFQIDD
jgi:serine protease Do